VNTVHTFILQKKKYQESKSKAQKRFSLISHFACNIINIKNTLVATTVAAIPATFIKIM